MRVLVIGYGSMGKRHAHNARELGHQVVVVDEDFDRRRRALKDSFFVQHNETQEHHANGPGAYAIWDQPMCRGIDAAIIATPAATHYDVARLLQEAGYEGPLLVEKPLDVTSEHADFWRSWPHVTACVGYNWRFVEGVREARGAKRVWARTWTDMTQWPGAEYASPPLECSHDLDIVRWLSGRSPMFTRNEEDCWVAWDDEGGVAEIALHPAQWRQLVVDGRLVYEFMHDREITAAVEPSYKAELEAFLTAAKQGVPVEDAATFEDGLAVVRIVEEAEAMARE